MAVQALAAVLAAAVLGSPRYGLEPGDHVVFRQRLERDVATPESRASTRFTWASHVLVLGVREGRALVGVQRTLENAELVRYMENGRDRTAAERPAFAAELDRRGRVFAEANRVTPHGQRLLPFQVVREASSELLPSIHELPPLPRGLDEGAWLEPELFGLRLVGKQEGSCRHIAGEQDRLHLTYTVCGGTLESLHLTATYDTPVSGRVDERLRSSAWSAARARAS